ncbi:hypothetical protein QGN32_09475 [Mycolicibacterium sp. ND9-15]|uniref:hypothetical protein n=1 Tax=Mycolicibacterium sp. ND9-15 TaxID=3042320 RepID=UPI002DDB85A9|nr:hypothetical protein [Mycolicibacterium sp. ND9-15]WSE58051.1 hypothetical protein QGN32_09475 [Mycolicibacterium sp. ND9-15]
MSKRSDAKKARRRKRQAARDARWVPDGVMDALADDVQLAAVLEHFDERITERGWVFDDDLSDEESALWCYPPSAADVPDEDLVDVTTIVLTADEAADIAHVVFVGTADDYQFNLEELFDCLDVVEGYRLGDPPPKFTA